MDDVRVTTSAGTVEGLHNGDVVEWRGIPFAAPPTGTRRWRPPEPPEPWSGVRDATQWAPDCPQQNWTGSRATRLDEDCLTLNIWAPAVRSAEPLPVLVWFYGGSFLFGSASATATDGANLARRGAIVVAANYRVGLFGFLAHPALSAESPHGSSGNYGLLDQLAALRWVRDNIAAFGGDASRVTAFGVSAGSASLGLLMTSPLAEGLFDRVILQSPGSFRPLAPHAMAEEAGLLLGDDIDALRALPAEAVLERTSLLVPAMRALTAPRVLRPHRDGWVVPTDDREAFEAGRFWAVPTLVGGNSDEGAKLVATWPIHTVADWQRCLADNFGAHADEAAAIYPATTDAAADTNAEVRDALAAAFGDTQFSFGARGIARASARRQPQTFRYLFLRRMPGASTGPHHGEEVPYVFGTLPPEADSADWALSDRMQAAWVRFAATGDPGERGRGGLQWPPADADGEPALVLAGVHRTLSGWRQEAFEFLDRFYDATETA